MTVNAVNQEKNLLRLSLEAVHEIISEEDKICEIIAEKTSIEYESLGLQIWLKDDITVDATSYSFIAN